jgi:hypothetical protein
MSRFLLWQIARNYQFIPMPAIPPQPGEAIDHSLAIRKLFRLIKRTRTLLSVWRLKQITCQLPVKMRGEFN